MDNSEKVVSRRKVVGDLLLKGLGLGLVGSGLSLLAGTQLAPLTTEKVFFTAKSEVEGAVSKANEKILNNLPVVRFKGEGGYPEMRNDGEFVHLIDYDQVEYLPQLWASHNLRGGDIILPWDKGQRFTGEGESMDGEWVVVDSKRVGKFGTVDTIFPIQGDAILQTCFYGEPFVKFLGIVRAEDYDHGWEPEDFSSMKIDPSGLKLTTEDYVWAD